MPLQVLPCCLCWLASGTGLGWWHPGGCRRMSMHSGALTCMQAHLHGMHLHPIPLSSNPQPAVCNAQENQVEPFYLIKQQDSVHPGGCSCIRAYSGACILLFYMTVHALAGSPVLPLLVSVRDGVSLNISSSKISVASGTCTYFRPAIRHAIASRRICTALQTALRIPIFFTWPI